MAWTIVKWGNYNSRIYIRYTFTANETARTWTLVANLRITIPSGYTFGPWVNTSAHTATLQANGMPELTGGDHDLTTDKQIASGTYDDAGNAPSVDVSWAFNVNSSWGGFENAYGTATLTGSAISPKIPSAPTLVTVTDGNDGTIYMGEQLTISASGASGVITGYDWQKSVNGGSWGSITGITESTFNDTIDADTTTVKYRMRAKNDTGNSSWKESNVVTITSNARSGEVLSGSFQTNKYDSKIGLKLSWSATQSVANNNSKLSWTLESTGGSTTAWWNAAPITVKINGTTVLSITDRFKLYGGGAWSKTGTITIAHNDDGSKSFSASISAAIYTNAVNCTGSATFTLKKIARTPSAPTACSITAGYENFVGLGDTVTIKWSGASGVITGYDLQYSRGNSGWKDYKSVTSSATSGSTTDSFTATNIDTNGAGQAVKYRVRAKNGSLTSAWKESNTLYISGGMDIKVSNAWKNGSVWIKVNGEWKRAKRVWIKVNGTWQYDKTK